MIIVFNTIISMAIPTNINTLGVNSNIGKFILYNSKGDKIVLFDSNTAVTAQYTFYDMSLTEWNLPLPNLEDGTYMFCKTKLTEWNINCPKLKNATQMFRDSTLSYVSPDISFETITNAQGMFWGTKITKLSGHKFENVTNGWAMFYATTVKILEDVTFENLQSGSQMFSSSLVQAHNLNLQKLSNGNAMFLGCPLDEETVLRVLNTIPEYTSGSYPLHIGKRTNWLNSEVVASLLNTTTPIVAGTNYQYKGWTITITN